MTQEDQNLRARVAQLEDRLAEIEGIHTVKDEDGQEWSASDLMEMGLTRRQALAAIGTLAIYGGSIWGAVRYATQDARAATDQVGTSSQRVDLFADAVDANSITTETVVSDYHFAGAFDGADADTRLGNALSAANNGDVIFLENARYTSARTYDSFRGTFLGSFSVSQNEGAQLAEDWTLDSRVHMYRIAVESNTDLNLNTTNINLSDISLGGTITVGGDRAVIQGVLGGEITFESGTSGGIVDSSADVTVTDNGSNTVGDFG